MAKEKNKEEKNRGGRPSKGLPPSYNISPLTVAKKIFESAKSVIPLGTKSRFDKK